MQTLFGRLATIIDRQPNKPAFILKNARGQWQTITFLQLLTTADHLASGLMARGLKPGMRAGVMIPPDIDFFALLLALLKIGIIPVMIDPAIGLGNVGKCLQESRPEIF